MALKSGVQNTNIRYGTIHSFFPPLSSSVPSASSPNVHPIQEIHRTTGTELVRVGTKRVAPADLGSPAVCREHPGPGAVTEQGARARGQG